MPSKKEIIQTLGLTHHVEGGYFKRVFESNILTSNNQLALSTIYYLLTDESPIGYFHQNKSDIIHFFHSGSAIEYTLISPEGRLTTHILGPHLELGHQFQLTVKGGVWKASQLLSGEYGLISEAVCPGFEYPDMKIASRKEFEECFPLLLNNIQQLIKH